MDPRVRKKAVREMWMKTVIGVVVAFAIGIGLYVVLIATSPDAEPPPETLLSTIDAGLHEDDCDLVASPSQGSEVEVRRRPRPMEMVVGHVADGVVLDVVSVRQSFVQVRAPVEGWIDRRETRRQCN